MTKQRSRDHAETSKHIHSICVTDAERLDEVIAVYEEHGYEVRRLQNVRTCDGECTQLVVSGLDNFRIAIPAPHDFAVVAIKHPDWPPNTEELMCPACLHANAEVSI